MDAGAEKLRAQLAGGVVQLARCWRVDRVDGVVMGFTDHDGDLSFDGVTFDALSGLDASAVERTTGLSVDNSQAAGALSSAAITEIDILSGRYDGATVREWLVNWTDPEARILLFRGSIGEIRERAVGFEAELRGLEDALNYPVGRSFMATCDRVLGDEKCGVDLSDPTYFADGIVSEARGNNQVVWSPASEFDGDWFRGGVISWTSGKNSGTQGLIREDRTTHAGRLFVLWADAALDIAVGDGFRVVAGCDKHAETCRTRFKNLINFRGFPYIPGEDWVTAYPRSGYEHDGRSIIWEEVDNV